MLSGLRWHSINLSSCVSQTVARFIRWGLASLVLTKFIPGFSTVAPPIARALRMGFSGSCSPRRQAQPSWASVATGAGWLLQDAVLGAIVTLKRHGDMAILLLFALFAIWLGWKLHERRSFRLRSGISFITAEELLETRNATPAPLLLDMHGTTMIAGTGPLPGARVASHAALLAREHACCFEHGNQGGI